MNSDTAGHIFPFQDELEMTEEMMDTEVISTDCYSAAHKNGLQMGHLNIFSIARKIDQLSEIITKEKYDVISVTESHLSSEIPDIYIYRLMVKQWSGKIEIDLEVELSFIADRI